jgi:hypothetical protein
VTLDRGTTERVLTCGTPSAGCGSAPLATGVEHLHQKRKRRRGRRKGVETSLHRIENSVGAADYHFIGAPSASISTASMATVVARRKSLVFTG